MDIKSLTQKIDLTKLYKSYYSATTQPRLEMLEAGQFICLEGQGAPGSPLFYNSIQTLFAVAYGVKSIYKKLLEDFVVPKLEGLWWVEDGKDALSVSREQWYWKLMIRMPAYVTAGDIEHVKAVIFHKKKLVLAPRVSLENGNGGLVVQCLHVGSYENETITLEAMKLYMEKMGVVQSGLHHEIYLSDATKVPTHKWKTILRLPVKQFGI
ncbi:hypothetical protein COR50_07010 [Chitinophaga caeni]|uniref:GyrI-like small molecule binding domain-containing protein n=1 Tax=Chitinophaga caeni TaxID=2029983 RepID=A0A291QSU7_9BACT|nr:GyrI-like domain-containing protein [Chitinophaga caeni]ATL46952.1 hypothetical protein COR50_07010 [Chitinophaga caeni]